MATEGKGLTCTVTLKWGTKKLDSKVIKFPPDIADYKREREFNIEHIISSTLQAWLKTPLKILDSLLEKDNK